MTLIRSAAPSPARANIAAARLSTIATAGVTDGKKDGLSAPNNSMESAKGDNGVTRLSAIETSAAPDRCTARATKWISCAYGLKLMANMASSERISSKSAMTDDPSAPTTVTFDRNSRQMYANARPGARQLRNAATRMRGARLRVFAASSIDSAVLAAATYPNAARWADIILSHKPVIR